jgi:hypothetical protein
MIFHIFFADIPAKDRLMLLEMVISMAQVNIRLDDDLKVVCQSIQEANSGKLTAHELVEN